MIAEVENLSVLSPEVSEALKARVQANGDRYIGDLRRWFFEMPPMDRPADWVERELTLDTPFARKQPFVFEGREYLREVIDDIDDPEVQAQTKCWGTGSSKTNSDLAMMLWAFKFDPFPGIYIMPTEKGSAGAVNFCNSCVVPTIRASACFTPMLPSRAQRHNFTGHKVEFAGNHLDFVGANSAAQIKHKRCRIMFLGEQDSYKETLGRESGTDYLAGERTKGMTNKKIIRGSTPTLEGVGIWPHLMGNSDTTGSDCRRRFLKCPSCKSNKRFVLVQDEQYTVLPRKLTDGSPIHFAMMRWDKEAKRIDGSWDIDRVIRSARFECPHCGFHLRDEHRTWLDRNGVWLATRKGEYRHRGYHLPSFYSPLLRDRDGQIDFDSTWGGMAQKFLRAQDSPAGMAGYINSDLAEVNINQEHAGGAAVEILSAQPRATSVLHIPIMSVDRQAKYPGFWYVVWEFVASVLKPARTAEQQAAHLKELPAEEKMICERLTGSLAPTKDAGMYSPEMILLHLQRTDHWPRIADWLIANGLIGARLTEFYQVEFQTDLIRLIEFIAKQPEVNITLGRQGDSQGLEVGSADAWDELDEVQRRYNVANPDVMVDARFGSMDNQEVFAECFRRCPANAFIYYSAIQTPYGAGNKFSQTPLPGMKPFSLGGWTPCMGFPEHKTWVTKDKIRLPYGQVVNDPFSGKMEARQFFQYVFQFDAQWALSELARVRKKYRFGLAPGVQFGGFNAQMQPVDQKEFDRHMKGYFWDDRKGQWDSPAKHGGSGSRWHPNHLYDCVKNAMARAVWKGIFRYQPPPGNK